MRRLAFLVFWGPAAAVFPAQPAQPAESVFPETPLERCLKSLGPDFLEDASGAWAVALSSQGAQEVAGPYDGFRRCLGYSRRDPSSIPIPSTLAIWVTGPQAGLWSLLDFYRTCLRDRSGKPYAPCKRLLKTYADGYLEERADWDEICSDWCRSFLASDDSACQRAVERFSDPVFKEKDPLVAMCREFTGLEPSACRAAHPLRKAACLERTIVAAAIRSGEAGSCPAELRASCEAAIAPQEDYCGRLHATRVAFALCRVR